MDLKEQIITQITSIEEDIFGCTKERDINQKWVKHYQDQIDLKMAIKAVLREKLKSLG